MIIWAWKLNNYMFEWNNSDEIFEWYILIFLKFKGKDFKFNTLQTQSLTLKISTKIWNIKKKNIAKFQNIKLS